MEGLDAQEAELAEEREEGGEDEEALAGLGAGTAPAASDASLAEALAEWDARIRELEGRVAEAARSAAAAEELRSQIEELKRQGEEQRVDFALTLAGCRSNKAARALLCDYDGDVGALAEAEPWLFEGGSSSFSGPGATGLPSAGAADGDGGRLSRWRVLAGLSE